MRHIRQPAPFQGVRQAPPVPGWWRRNPRLALGLVTGAITGLVAAIVLFPVLPSQRPAPPVTAVEPALPASPAATPSRAADRKATKTRQGVFLTTYAELTEYQSWLGRRVPDVVHFSDRQTWEDIADPDLGPWNGRGHRLIYAVPMLPRADQATRQASMRAGASGAYDHYFTSLARHLVAEGHRDAVLRVGWEFNLTSWPWGIADEAVFVRYFRRIVTAMRSVHGERFSITWNVNNGYNPHDGSKYYPGNAFVDSVGVDAYDLDATVYPYPKGCAAQCRQLRQQRAWDEVIYGGPRGLGYWSEFAAEHHKPLSLPEWGLWAMADGSGGGGGPFFVEQMHDVIG